MGRMADPFHDVECGPRHLLRQGDGMDRKPHGRVAIAMQDLDRYIEAGIKRHKLVDLGQDAGAL